MKAQVIFGKRLKSKSEKSMVCGMSRYKFNYTYPV